MPPGEWEESGYQGDVDEENQEILECGVTGNQVIEGLGAAESQEYVIVVEWEN